jgi:transcriptional regulator with XRE-family HTH domain
MIDWKEFADAIKETRKRRGLTQEEAARELGTNQTRVSHVESGYFRSLDGDTFAVLCRWMGRSMHEFEVRKGERVKERVGV